VGILSNFLGLRDGRQEEAPTLVRPATAAETTAGLRLVLGSNGSPAHEQHVQEFLAFATERSIDLTLMWVAEQAGRLTLAALPIPSPGRTMLVFASPAPSRAAEGTVSQLIDATCETAAQNGVHLAQALLDPVDEVGRRVYMAAGFEAMAELIYLNGPPRADVTAPVPPPAGLHWEGYTPRNHARFAEAILTSYEESLDCPALNGVRDIEDVIEGHKASGVFDPRHWQILCEGDRPVGVLLLADTGRGAEAMELVYLGLAKAARGRKLGEVMMARAMGIVAVFGYQRLTLAVDARNVPALKLYYRQGMNRVASKIALMRDLRASR
jgi:ribosomal protein S18 acetylase RimI-like enzyme